MADTPRRDLPEINSWDIHTPGIFIPLDPTAAQGDILGQDITDRIMASGIPAFMIRADMRKPLPLLPYNPETSGKLGLTSIASLQGHLEGLPLSNQTRRNVRFGVFRMHRTAVQRQAEWVSFQQRYERRRADPALNDGSAHAAWLRRELEKGRQNAKLEVYENPFLFTVNDTGEKQIYEQGGEPDIDLDVLLLFFQHKVFASSYTMNKSRYSKGIGGVSRYALTHFMNSRIAAATQESLD